MAGAGEYRWLIRPSGGRVLVTGWPNTDNKPFGRQLRVEGTGHLRYGTGPHQAAHHPGATIVFRASQNNKVCADVYHFDHDGRLQFSDQLYSNSFILESHNPHPFDHALDNNDSGNETTVEPCIRCGKGYKTPESMERHEKDCNLNQQG